MKFSNLTIDQYQRIIDLETNEEPSTARAYKKLAIALDKTITEVIEMDINKRNFILANLNKPNRLPLKKYIFVNGWVYKATTSLTEMNTMQLIDFNSLANNKASLNDLLAVMYVPLFGKYKAKNHKKLSLKLSKTKVKKTLGLLFFWSDYSKKCEKRTLTFLEKQAQMIQELMKEIQTDKEFQTFYQTTAGNIT
jgi:hypothetical protein